MQELTMQEIHSVSGAGFGQSLGTCELSVIGGVLGGAISGATGGWGGVLTGAIDGAISAYMGNCRA